MYSLYVNSIDISKKYVYNFGGLVSDVGMTNSTTIQSEPTTTQPPKLTMDNNILLGGDVDQKTEEMIKVALMQQQLETSTDLNNLSTLVQLGGIETMESFTLPTFTILEGLPPGGESMQQDVLEMLGYSDIDLSYFVQGLTEEIGSSLSQTYIQEMESIGHKLNGLVRADLHVLDGVEDSEAGLAIGKLITNAVLLTLSNWAMSARHQNIVDWEGFKDTYVDGFPFFTERSADSRISWTNKYKNGDPNQGEAFPLSTSYLVGFTDTFHFLSLLGKQTANGAMVVNTRSKSPDLFDVDIPTRAHLSGYYGMKLLGGVLKGLQERALFQRYDLPSGGTTTLHNAYVNNKFIDPDQQRKYNMSRLSYQATLNAGMLWSVISGSVGLQDKVIISVKGKSKQLPRRLVVIADVLVTDIVVSAISRSFQVTNR